MNSDDGAGGHGSISSVNPVVDTVMVMRHLLCTMGIGWAFFVITDVN
jgi:hypothetical protein